MASERRAAKEAYLAALKLQVTVDDESSRYDKLQRNHNEVHAPNKASERERILDERQLEFLRKQDRTLHRTAQASSQLQDDQHRNQIDVSYRIGANIKSHQIEGSNVGRDSHEPQKSFDPGAWKREGYPSEYAYAQSNGALNINPSKGRYGNQVDSRDHTDRGIVSEESSTSYLNSQLREQVQEASYPDHRDYPPQLYREADRLADNSHVYQAAKGGITAIGNVNDKLAKKAKQAEYAQYLEGQMLAREQRDNAGKQGQNAINSVNDRSNAGFGLQNMGSVKDDKSAKRSKQAEYARDLQQQQRVNQEEMFKVQRADRKYQQQHEIEEQQHYDDNRHTRNGYQQQVYQEKNQNQQQLSYRMQHEEQQQHRERAPLSLSRYDDEYDKHSYRNESPQRQVSYGYSDVEAVSRAQGLGSRTTPNSMSPALDPKREEIAAKRAKQLEYAQSLSDQQLFKQQRHREVKAHSGMPSHSAVPGGYSNPSNQNNRSVDEVTEKQLKKAKQTEYAQALQRQQSMQHSSASTSGVHRSSHSPGKRSLEKRERGRDPRENEGAPVRLTGQNGSGGLEDGWVIGPLGQPVRRTLEVGHRGVQKVFNQNQKQSESPRHSGDKRRGGGGGGGGNDGYDSEGGNEGGSYGDNTSSSFSPDHRYRDGPGQQQQQGLALGHIRGYDRNPYLEDNGYDAHEYRQDDAHGGGESYYGDKEASGSVGTWNKANFKAHNFEPRTALDADVLDERKVKAKYMQTDQARALQMQMKDNADRLASEKEKKGKEELLELNRLEVERVAMVKAFEREQQEGRKKADDDNKRALLYQAEEKKRAKEEEEMKELERSEREDRKVTEEQQAVRRREMAELQRERNPGIEGQGPQGSRSNLFKESPSVSPNKNLLVATAAGHQPRGKESSGESQWDAPPRLQGAGSSPSSSSPSKRNGRSDRDGDEDRNRNRNSGINELERSMRGVSMKELHRDTERDRDRDFSYDDLYRDSDHGNSNGSNSGGYSPSSVREGRVSGRGGSHGQRDRPEMGGQQSYGDPDHRTRGDRDKDRERERNREREKVGLGGGGMPNRNSDIIHQLDGTRRGWWVGASQRNKYSLNPPFSSHCSQQHFHRRKC